MKYTKKYLIGLIILLFPLSLFSQPLHYGGCWLLDTDGRYMNPKGFVIIMEDRAGKFDYDADDYARMVRYGANVQVIRIGIGQLAGLEGEAEKKSYLERIDKRVQLAKEAGLKTIFKMTVYGLRDFNHKWETIFDQNGENRKNLFIAWGQIWEKYANEPTVLGYDFLNESRRPQQGDRLRSYEEVTQNSLIPLYRELIQKMVSYSPDKWAIYQPLLIDNDDRGKTSDGLDGLPMWHIQMPKLHDRMIYAPHGYFPNSAMHARAVKRHLLDAQASGAALMMGEWGRQTYAINDTNLIQQLAYTQLYAEVANIFDNAGMGLIKAWFNGTRKANKEGSGLTWSVFSDTTATGTAERKYIMDVICRPYPLFMAGSMVDDYGFNFTNRTFSMSFHKTNFPGGVSEIYIPEDRHFPDGFTIIYNGKVMLARDKESESGLRSLKTIDEFSEDSFWYDSETQHLYISKWDLKENYSSIKIIPGTRYL